MRRTIVATAALLTLVFGAAPLAEAAPPPSRQARQSTPNQQPTREWKQADGSTVAGPGLPAGSGAGRRVVYSVSQQRVWLATDTDQVEKTYLVSGRRGTPRPGTYRVFSASRYSSSGSLRLEYMVRFAKGRRLAIGFHSIPTRRNGTPIQSEAELGQYRSAGCVRQRLSDAAYLWGFAPVGTTVVVTP